MLSKNIVSIRVDDKDSKFGRMFGNDEYGYQCLVGVTEDGEETEAYWIDIDEFKNNNKILYPEQIFKYL